MAAFFADQLDFILFFYGLAFILLGAVCFAVARGTAAASAPSTVAWGVLGLFSYLHGAGEWLDLIALIFGDTTLFALGRTALMTASYMVLLDFGRLDTSRCGFRVPERWIYAPLLPQGTVDILTLADGPRRSTTISVTWLATPC